MPQQHLLTQRTSAHQPVPRTTLCCVCCTAHSETNHRSVHACFQTLSGRLGFLQVVASPSNGPTTIPGVTLDSDSHVSMSHPKFSTEDAPEAARAAGECMTAAREEVGISQGSISTSTSTDAESASPPPLSMTQQALVGVGRVAYGGLFAAAATVMVGAAAVKRLPCPTIPRPRLPSFPLW